MWKSKPLSSKTLPRLWKRVYWIPRLFGRILKPSIQTHFTTKYTASLPDIHASPSASSVSVPELTIPDTFTRILNLQSTQLDLFGVSSKMSPDTSPWDLITFTKAFDLWVTELRQASTQRKRSARRTLESAYSSLHWMTPDTQNGREGSKLRKEVKEGVNHALSLHHQIYLIHSGKWKTPGANETEGGTMLHLTGDAKYKLRDQVHWSTPMSQDYGGSTREDFTPKLSQQVKKKWATPSTGDSKNNGIRDFSNHELLITQILKISPCHQDPSNSNGKPRAYLNPAWVAQLMGTTIEKTFYACMEMESFGPQPPKHLPNSGANI
jgi:hypothetical protein